MRTLTSARGLAHPTSTAMQQIGATAFSPGLSIILPAYNEEGPLSVTVGAVVTALRKWSVPYEVIIVNDGSIDHTGVIAMALAAANPCVRCVHHTINQGYGAALASGFAAATQDLIFFMDADGQFAIEDLAAFAPLITRYDAVLGYRAHRKDTWVRRLNAWGWKQLVWIALGVRVRDVDCAFKLFHTSFFRTHPLETRGAMINAEILYKLQRDGGRYAQTPVRHLPRQSGRATGARPAVIARALRELARQTWVWRLRPWLVSRGRTRQPLIARWSGPGRRLSQATGPNSSAR
jgi:glycosyltransferase involved in cell wall biosynthesis